MVGPTKRRKVSTLGEISFDSAAREEFLTGFHKRKQQRILHAKEQAIQRERDERIKERKRLREQRKQELEAQLAVVNAQFKYETRDDDTVVETSASEVEANHDSEGTPDSGKADHGGESFGADEYIDEGKFTTVTVESVEISKHGAAPLEMHTSQDELVTSHHTPTASGSSQRTMDGNPTKVKPHRSKTYGKKKFRYESAGERKKARAKIKLKKSLHSMKRRSK